MKIVHYTEIQPGKPSGATSCALPGSGITGRVAIGRADGAERFCMRVFHLAPDARTNRHAHQWEHEVFVHAGQGAVLREGTWIPLTAGSVVHVLPMEEHQFQNTGKDPLVFVCVIPSAAPEL